MKGSQLGVMFTMFVVSALAFGQVPIQIEDQMILAVDGRELHEFGFAIDANETTAVITAKGFEYIGSYTAGAYVYERISDGSWDLVAILRAPGISGRENFGASVAIDIEGNTIAVGAPGVDGTFGRRDQGAVFVFERNGAGQWDLRARLLASDSELRHNLGGTVDIDGNTIVAGAHAYRDNTRRGAAYVFTRDETSGLWPTTETQRLIPNDLANFDFFGSRLALDGDNLFVVSTGDDDLGPSTGSVYRYKRDNTGYWVFQPPKMYNPEGLRLGGIALDGETLMTTGGAYNDDGEAVGAVFVYEDGGASWVHQSTFFAGGYITLSGDRVVMGDTSAMSIYWPMGNVGAAHVYDRRGTDWEKTATLVATDGYIGDQMGYAVGISGDDVIVGAFRDDDIGQDSGAAYAFNLPSNTPPIPNAGADQTVQAIYADGSADVTLDGSGSTDPDADPLTYSWSLNGQLLASGVFPTVTLALGTHTITLTVNDGKDTASDDVVITVEATIDGLRDLLAAVIAQEDLPLKLIAKLNGDLNKADDGVRDGNYGRAIEALTEFKGRIDKAIDRDQMSEANGDMLKNSATATQTVIGSY